MEQEGADDLTERLGEFTEIIKEVFQFILDSPE